MKSLFDPGAEQAVLERIDRLTVECTPRWGSNSVGAILCHLADYFELALGTATPERELPRLVQLVAGPMLVYWPFPMPKGAPTSPDLWRTPPSEFERDRERLKGLVREFVARRAQRVWPRNPIAGNVGATGWGRLAYGHTNHHLKQFGV